MNSFNGILINRYLNTYFFLPLCPPLEGEDDCTSIISIQNLILVSGFKSPPQEGGRGEDNYTTINQRDIIFN
jgi:hypothetical protein